MSRYYFHLTKLSVFEARGHDALRYLNARLTQDIRALQLGDCRLAAALTPQGRTQALFTVLRPDTESFLLLSEPDDHAATLEVLKKYLVADRVSVTDLSATYSAMHLAVEEQDLPVLSRVLAQEAGLDALPAAAWQMTRSERAICVRQPRSIERCSYDLLFKDRPALVETVATALALTELPPADRELLRFRAALPSFPQEINEALIFSETGRREGLAFNKGCYVGQEVIERADALGKLPRILIALEIAGDEPIPPGAAVAPRTAGGGRTEEDDRVGKVVSAAQDPAAQRSYCFAIVRNVEYADDAGFTVAGRSARRLRPSIT